MQTPDCSKEQEQSFIFTIGIVVFVGAAIAIATPVVMWNADEIAQVLAESDKIKFTPEIYPYFIGMLALLVGTLGIVWKMLKTLLDLVRSVEDGTPFSRINAARLRMIGWLMIAIQVVGIPLAQLAAHVEEAIDPSKSVSHDLGLSMNSVLAILIAFILAGVFEQGAEMREELEGTV